MLLATFVDYVKCRKIASELYFYVLLVLCKTSSAHKRASLIFGRSIQE